jgi:hypothetical protein
MVLHCHWLCPNIEYFIGGCIPPYPLIAWQGFRFSQKKEIFACQDPCRLTDRKPKNIHLTSNFYKLPLILNLIGNNWSLFTCKYPYFYYSILRGTDSWNCISLYFLFLVETGRSWISCEKYKCCSQWVWTNIRIDG